MEKRQKSHKSRKNGQNKSPTAVFRNGNRQVVLQNKGQKGILHLVAEWRGVSLKNRARRILFGIGLALLGMSHHSVRKIAEGPGRAK